ICPRLPNQAFVVPPSEEELVTFIQELGYSGKCDMLSAIHTDQMHQPWRTFAAIINRCISGKTTGLDRLRESRAQILWGMYNKKNVDYVALLWEDFMYQADNREISLARKEHTPYPRFTKVIISNFISKDKTISMRNMINLHIIYDDSFLGTLKFVSKTQDYQQYGSLIPDDMINQDIKDSKYYKTYYDVATGKATPKKARKYKKVASPSRKLSPVLEEEHAEKPKRTRKPAKKSTTVPTAALLEAAQVKEDLKKSKKESHMLHPSGSDDGVGSQPKVCQEESGTLAPPLLTVPVTAISETSTVATTIILPKEISDFATPVIQRTINESLKNLVLAKSSSQPQLTYKAATSLTKFELKKILLDKLEKTYSLKRGREDKDKDEDPPAGPDQGLKKRKTSKESAQAEELVFETADTETPQDQGGDLGNTEDQPSVEEASKYDWFKKPERPRTLDRDWNAGKQIDFRPPQTWISKMAKAGKPPTTFDELMSTPIDFSAYVLHNLKIENLTQEHLVGPAFNLLKGTCKSRVELEFHFKECYKVVTDKLDWMNHEGHEYPFDLSKPLPLIEDQGLQVVLANYFFNNDLEYLKGGSLSSKYMTSTTKTKGDKYDTIDGMEDMVPSL
ncbi:hypothetical protein Tco_0962918, partial [Tanacetum coccineum]